MGTLFIVSTPIGNLEDITIRAVKILFSADVILCEDTRRTGILMSELLARYSEQFDSSPEWKPIYMPYYEQIENKKLPEAIELLRAGSDLALVSDAGTPLVSDPGFRLVRECHVRKIPVQSIPGPSASLAALTVSGLPTDRFFFLGYPPEKQSQRRTLFTNLRQSATLFPTTYLLYCAPHKLKTVLSDMEQALGNIPIVITRELTKIHEEVWSGTVEEAIYLERLMQGELVILFRLER